MLETFFARCRRYAGLTLLASLPLAACKEPTPASPPPETPRSQAPLPSPASAAGFESAVVRAADAAALYEAPAQVQLPPTASADIAPPYRAQITELHVRPGQEVLAEAPIATVLMPEVTQAAGTYLGAALRLQAYEQRRQQLISLKAEGLMRLADLAETEARLAEARATQLESRAILQAAGWKTTDAAQLAAQLESRAGRVTLRAPIRGIVLEVRGTLGQRWEPGAPPIARLIGGSDAELRVEARLASGLPKAARYSFRTATGLQAPLRLLSTAPVVDARDGTVTSWFAFATPPAPGALQSGLTGKVLVEPEAGAAAARDTSEQLVVVPSRAVRWQRSQPEVLRAPGPSGGPPQALPVRVVMNLGSELVIAAALTPGESVVLASGREAATGEQP